MAKSMFTLVRTHEGTGREYRVENLTLRDVRQQVAWCMTDNVGLTRPDAARIADGIKDAVQTLTVHGYRFDLIPVTA
jgi:hypothetical protein